MYIRFLTCLILGCVPLTTLATILTFDKTPAISNFESVNQAYGDDVEAVTETEGAVSFAYGVGIEGFTPHVQVSFTGNRAPDPALWNTGYGDLANVLFDDNDGNGSLHVILSAEPGYSVQLYDWEMASFTNAGQIINAVRVTVDNVIEFALSDVAVPGVGHADFDFIAPFSGSTVVLELDSLDEGTFSDNIAFDNIRFGEQVSIVPVPAALPLMVLALGSILGVSCRPNRG